MKKRVLTFVFLLLGTLAFVSCQKDNAEDGTLGERMANRRAMPC